MRHRTESIIIRIVIKIASARRKRNERNTFSTINVASAEKCLRYDVDVTHDCVRRIGYEIFIFAAECNVVRYTYV